ISGRDGNSTRSRWTSWPRAPPSIGSTTAISTGRPRIVSRATSQVVARASEKGGTTAPRNLWYWRSETAASTSIPLHVLRSYLMPQNRPTMPQNRPKRGTLLHASCRILRLTIQLPWRPYVPPHSLRPSVGPRLVRSHCFGVCRCVGSERRVRHQQSGDLPLVLRTQRRQGR